MTVPSASRPLSLRVNFSWTFAGNMAYALSQWGIIMVLARLGSATLVGMYTQGNAIAATVMAVAMLHLRSVQVTDVRHQHTFADYFGTRITATFVGLLVIVGLGAWWTESRVELWVLALVGLTKFLESVSDIVRGLFQRHERMDYSGISLVLKGPVALLVMAIVMWWTEDIVSAMASVAVVYFLTFMLYDLTEARWILGATDQPSREHRRLLPRFAPRTMVTLAWTSLPLGVVMGLITLQIQIPRLVLEGFAGMEALGYFATIVYPMQVGQMVVSALGQSAAPRLATYYVQNRPAYSRLVNKLVLLSAGLAAAIVLGTLVFGRLFLHIYGADYAQYHREFFIIAVAASVQLFSSAWGYALTSARRFHLQVVLIGASCVCMVIASFALIPRWGIAGAAFSVLISSLASAILYFFAVRSAIKAPAPPSEPPAQAAMDVQSDAEAAVDYT